MNDKKSYERRRKRKLNFKAKISRAVSETAMLITCADTKEEIEVLLSNFAVIITHHVSVYLKAELNDE